MSDELLKPSLVDPDAMGGDIAEAGFKFQDHLILARIPLWLACDGFTEMIREALGDTEARFFAPDLGTVREFVEYKNHHLTPSEFWPEIERFFNLDAAHSGSYWRFVLVCTGVSDLLKPMINSLRRVREAFPFYSSSPTIQDVSYEAFVAAVQKLGKDESMASFLFAKIIVDTDPPKSVDHGFEVFRGSLERHFPSFQDMGAKQARAAWDALASLVSSRKSNPIGRAELETAIWSGVDRGQPTAPAIRVLTAGEPLTDRWELPPDLRFDWSAFSGGADRTFPPIEAWNDIVVGQLRATRTWIVSTNRRRRIILTGERRLSASVAIGSIFSAVSGFAIDIHHRESIWSTDEHATSETPRYAWRIGFPTQVKSPGLAVTIGIIHDVAPEVHAYLSERSLDMPVLELHVVDSLISAQHANAAIREVKDAILTALAETGADEINLFLATPAHFALFLGHRLNAIGIIQCYERVGPNRYQATCRLSQR